MKRLVECAAVAISVMFPFVATAQNGKYLCGEMHSHTWASDGGSNLGDVVRNSVGRTGVDWMATSDHGGESERNYDGTFWDVMKPAPKLLGDPPIGTKHARMWRWQVLRDFLPAALETERKAYPGKIILGCFEWNVPTHDHAAIGMVGENAMLRLAQFSYLFDAEDTSSSSDAHLGVSGKVRENTHQKALAGARWLEMNARGSAFMTVHHPSRTLGYDIVALRDLNDAAPNVFVAVEMIPGHQKARKRAEYDETEAKHFTGSDPTPRLRVYDGVDYMLAKVGGPGDALWGEGRRIWAITGADFHDPSESFYPAEFDRTYVFVRDLDGDKKYSETEFVQGFRAGNIFIAEGGVIDALEFQLRSSSGKTATIGETLLVKPGDTVSASVRFKSPDTNGHGKPVVDHVDLIAGNVTGKAAAGTPGYSADSNPSTRVVARLGSSAISDVDGWRAVSHNLGPVTKSMYVRLRGTNLGVNQPGATDSEGNPLADPLDAASSVQSVYKHLWFYSNPVFIKVQR